MTVDTVLDLQAQIDERSREINTDNYPMSIGELASMYRDKEIEIHPEFQRFYRWTHTQKTRLIESILLGIPVPPIFVAQREDGVWDVVDGLQRLSTILEFMGLLKDETATRTPRLNWTGRDTSPLSRRSGGRTGARQGIASATPRDLRSSARSSMSSSSSARVTRARSTSCSSG